METKTMTRTDVRSLVGDSPGNNTPLMLIIERAAKDPLFDVGKLQALLDMQERFSKEEARKAFVIALTDFKADPPELFKDKAVDFGNTHYKHSRLGDASAQIGAALAKHGLSHRWNVDQTPEGRIAVTCILTHVKGHSESVRMESASDQSGGKNSIQAIGSATSYLQRYTLFAAAGVIAKDQDDDDGTQTEARPTLKEPQRKTESKQESLPESNTLTFVPEVVTWKEGEGKKGPWKKVGVKLPGERGWAGSFDLTIGEIAESAKENKEEITLTYKKDGAYLTIVDLFKTEKQAA